MKRMISLILALCIVIVSVPLQASAKLAVHIWDGTIASGFASGSGTEEDPYIVETPEQLAYLAYSVNNPKKAGVYILATESYVGNANDNFPPVGAAYMNTFFKLTKDIYLNSTVNYKSWENSPPQNEWDAIGGSNYYFAGNFDGGEHTIYGLYINKSENYQGLFGRTYQGTIKNLSVQQSHVKGNDYVGGIVGFSYISRKSSWTPTVENCHNYASVKGSNAVGGIAGKNHNYEVDAAAIINGCSNYGSVHGTGNVGGIAGESYGYCSIGAHIKQCANYGNVTGTNAVGGICGYSHPSLGGQSYIQDCYNTADVSGSYQVGGILGNGIGNYSYEARETNCYNIGTVRGNYYLGGIIGRNSTGTISKCYYLENSAEDNTGKKQGGIGNSSRGASTEDKIGKTESLSSEDLKNQSSFVGWDFDKIWIMPENGDYSYPILRCLNNLLSKQSIER